MALSLQYPLTLNLRCCTKQISADSHCLHKNESPTPRHNSHRRHSEKLLHSAPGLFDTPDRDFVLPPKRPKPGRLPRTPSPRENPMTPSSCRAKKLKIQSSLRRSPDDSILTTPFFALGLRPPPRRLQPVFGLRLFIRGVCKIV